MLLHKTSNLWYIFFIIAFRAIEKYQKRAFSEHQYTCGGQICFDVLNGFDNHVDT